MPSLTFYRQARQDGGVRTGVEIDGETALGLFEEGLEDEDPVLSWWLVVEASGEQLPDRPESARRWLLDHATEIRGTLLAMAGSLGAGLDMDAWPYRPAPMVMAVDGGQILITTTCAVSRRSEGQNLTQLLAEVAGRWEEILVSLPTQQEVAS